MARGPHWFVCHASSPANAVPDLIVPIELILDECAQEHSIANGTYHVLAKAFDTMPLRAGGLGWILLQRAGCPLPIIDAMKDLYSRINRRFKVLSHLGKPVTAEGKRGCVQGCALFQLQDRGTTSKPLVFFPALARRGGPSISCFCF